ncbi:MAG: AI-2E family transporter [Verrucomicrobia bacterium]|nr:MAG: AI-2E family transporter [Verrucomicrobiota bacterium]
MNALPPPSPQQARIIWFSLTALALVAMGGLVVLVVWGFGQALRLLAPVLWPLAVGGVIAYLLDPVVDWMVARRIPRVRAIALVFVMALLIVAGFFSSLLPQVFGEARLFVERVPAYTQKIQQRLDFWATNPPVAVRKILKVRAIFGRSTNALPELSLNNDAPAPRGPAPQAPGSRMPDISSETIRSFTGWIGDFLGVFGSWVSGQVSRVGSWFGIVVGLCLIPVYAFHFLLEKRGIERQWTEYLPVRTSWYKEEIVFCIRAINDYLIVFFRSQVLVALSDGILYTLGFLIIGLPYAFLIGAMATALTMIPFIGAITTCGTAVVVAFAATGSWHLPAAVLAVFGIVQTLEALVISPKIMGDRVGLHPLTIIIAVMVGTTLLGGVLGGLLAIPATAALRVIMFRYVWRRKEPVAAESPATT